MYQSDFEIGQLSDKALNAQINAHCDKPEWSDEDIKQAISALCDDIIDNNREWDYDGSYQVDFAIECARIIKHEPKDERLALIQQAFSKRVNDWCIFAVNEKTDFYCERYCD